MRSSLGFHTITLSMLLLNGEIKQLNSDFVNYSRKKRCIQMYPAKNNNLVIRFHPMDMGIKWEICHDVWINGFEMFFDIINVTINPKILAGTHDYITAATYQDMNVVIANFNAIMGRISPLLKTFDQYELKRIDYCINFDLSELAPGCSADQIMNLIRRSNIPTHFKEWTEYDYISHRNKSKPGSFYLISPSTNINCYSKYMQLQGHSRENEEKGYPPVPQKTLEAAKNIIRFEVQCKYHKTYTLSHRAKESGNSEYNKYKSLLSDEVCIEMVADYFQKTIQRGDWYALQEAIHMVERENYNCQKENRLINALKLVSQCRSFAMAKTAYQGEDLKAFKRTISDLACLNINPVTIPREWGIRHIPNLLRTYFDKAQEERAMAEMKDFSAGIFKEFYSRRKKKRENFYQKQDILC